MEEKSSISHKVRAAAVGDELAWNHLYQSFHANLFHLALKICGNTPEAKDAVQDTFMIAYLKLAQLKDPKSFQSWINKICIHCCYRAIRNNRLITHSAPLESDIWWENEFENKLNAFSKQEHIFEMLSKLPTDLRSTLILRYYSSHQSYDEISSILSIPVGTVRSRLNQAKQKLSEYWKPGDPIDERPFVLCEEWNGFYREHFSAMHFSFETRNSLINHLSKDLKLILSSGSINYGRTIVEKEIEDDILYGTCFGHLNIISSENITVLEAQNINSREFPERCPDTTVFVLSRSGKQVTQIHLHNSH